MSRQYWSETLAWATASGTAVATSTTETVLFPNITVPGNYMQDGRVLRVTASGRLGTTATPTLVVALRWGGVSGTILGRTNLNVMTSGVGGGASMRAMWALEAWVQTRSNGSSGSAWTNGILWIFDDTLVTAGTVTRYGIPCPIGSGSIVSATTGPAVVSSLDLTADTALSLTATWGTSNAANSIIGDQYLVEGMN